MEKSHNSFSSLPCESQGKGGAWERHGEQSPAGFANFVKGSGPRGRQGAIAGLQTASLSRHGQGLLNPDHHLGGWMDDAVGPAFMHKGWQTVWGRVAAAGCRDARGWQFETAAEQLCAGCSVHHIRGSKGTVANRKTVEPRHSRKASLPCPKEPLEKARGISLMCEARSLEPSAV